MAAAHLDPKQQQQWGNVGQTVVCRSDRANPLELPGVLDPEALNEAQLLGMRLRLVADQMEGDYRGRRRDRLEMERLEHAIMRVMYDLVTCRLF
uniref:Uncharacterized protein n=1 Tax=Trichuris muris TaxID=70415 RepID=A0A5S6Q503_TRIMR